MVLSECRTDHVPSTPPFSVYYKWYAHLKNDYIGECIFFFFLKTQFLQSKDFTERFAYQKEIIYICPNPCDIRPFAHVGPSLQGLGQQCHLTLASQIEFTTASMKDSM